MGDLYVSLDMHLKFKKKEENIQCLQLLIAGVFKELQRLPTPTLYVIIHEVLPQEALHAFPSNRRQNS
jgi:hypothetical protein